MSDTSRLVPEYTVQWVSDTANTPGLLSFVLAFAGRDRHHILQIIRDSEKVCNMTQDQVFPGAIATTKTTRQM